MKPSPTQLAGLHAIRELQGVKVCVTEDGRGIVSPAKLYDKPVEPPTYRTIKALVDKGWVEKYQLFTSVTKTKYKYYRITVKGRAVLDGL